MKKFIIYINKTFILYLYNINIYNKNYKNKMFQIIVKFDKKN